MRSKARARIFIFVFAVAGVVGCGEHGSSRAARMLPVPAVLSAHADTLEAYPRPGAEPWLGVRIQEFDASLREAFDYEGNGIIVTGVSPGSPAERAGMRPGDVITRVDGEDIHTKEDLARHVHGRNPGGVLVVRLRREGKEKTVEATLEAGRESPDSAAWPWRATSYLGARVEALNPDLASYFGVEPGTGVLILAVTEGAPAARAGLKPGDVLTRLDGGEVRSPADLAAFLRGRVPDSRVVATVVRHGREERIDVVLGASSTLDQLLDQLHVERDGIDSLLGELRGRVNGGQGHLSARMKKLEEMILELQKKMDGLVDRALR